MGPAFVSALEKTKLKGLALEADYQLQVEDALLFSEYDKVIVVDASKKGKEPFSWKKLQPAKKYSFTTHALPPEAVLDLCLTLYGKKPQAFLLAIRGYDFEIGEGLSPAAGRNLRAALRFFENKFYSATPEEGASAIIKIPAKLKREKHRHGKKQKRSSGA